MKLFTNKIISNLLLSLIVINILASNIILISTLKINDSEKVLNELKFDDKFLSLNKAIGKDDNKDSLSLSLSKPEVEKDLKVTKESKKDSLPKVPKLNLDKLSPSTSTDKPEDKQSPTIAPVRIKPLFFLNNEFFDDNKEVLTSMLKYHSSQVDTKDSTLIAKLDKEISLALNKHLTSGNVSISNSQVDKLHKDITSAKYKEISEKTLINHLVFRVFNGCEVSLKLLSKIKPITKESFANNEQLLSKIKNKLAFVDYYAFYYTGVMNYESKIFYHSVLYSSLLQNKEIELNSMLNRYKNSKKTSKLNKLKKKQRKSESKDNTRYSTFAYRYTPKLTRDFLSSLKQTFNNSNHKVRKYLNTENGKIEAQIKLDRNPSVLKNYLNIKDVDFSGTLRHVMLYDSNNIHTNLLKKQIQFKFDNLSCVMNYRPHGIVDSFGWSYGIKTILGNNVLYQDNNTNKVINENKILFNSIISYVLIYTNSKNLKHINMFKTTYEKFENDEVNKMIVFLANKHNVAFKDIINKIITSDSKMLDNTDINQIQLLISKHILKVENDQTLNKCSDKDFHIQFYFNSGNLSHSDLYVKDKVYTSKLGMKELITHENNDITDKFGGIEFLFCKEIKKDEKISEDKLKNSSDFMFGDKIVPISSEVVIPADLSNNNSSVKENSVKESKDSSKMLQSEIVSEGNSNNMLNLDNNFGKVDTRMVSSEVLSNNDEALQQLNESIVHVINIAEFTRGMNGSDIEEQRNNGSNSNINELEFSSVVKKEANNSFDFNTGDIKSEAVNNGGMFDSMVSASSGSKKSEVTNNNNGGMFDSMVSASSGSKKSEVVNNNNNGGMFDSMVSASGKNTSKHSSLSGNGNVMGNGGFMMDSLDVNNNSNSIKGNLTTSDIKKQEESASKVNPYLPKDLASKKEESATANPVNPYLPKDLTSKKEEEKSSTVNPYLPKDTSSKKETPNTTGGNPYLNNSTTAKSEDNNNNNIKDKKEEMEDSANWGFKK